MVAPASSIAITGMASGNGKFNSSEQPGAVGSLIAGANFTDGQLIPASIMTGATWNSYNPTRTIESGAMRLDYLGGVDVASAPALDITIADLNLNDVYVSFRSRMPGTKGGCKFVKWFGKNNGNYHNATFGTTYSPESGEANGDINRISFGDGSGTSGDTANFVQLKGGYPAGVGRAYPATASVLTPQEANFTGADWGTTWHEFKMRMRFNSGTSALNEVADGIFYLEIDGKVYANVTGIFNRHYSNSLYFDYIAFGGHAQSNPSDFQLYFDDIKVSVGGFA